MQRKRVPEGGWATGVSHYLQVSQPNQAKVGKDEGAHTLMI